jgi:hypothetical protein
MATARVVIPKVKHIITLDDGKYSIRLPDYYGTFGSKFGVTKAPSPDSTKYAGTISRDDYRYGNVLKLKARGTTGTGTTKKTRDFTFAVPYSKAAQAIAELDSKSVTVDSKVYDLGEDRIPQRRRFS